MARKKQTQSEQSKLIKTINRRVVQIAKSFGTESLAYKRAIANITIPDSYRKTKDGIVQLRNTKQTQSGVNLKNILKRTPTVKAIKSRFKKEISEVYGIPQSKVTTSMVQERMSKSDYVQSFLDDESNKRLVYQIEQLNSLLRKGGERKTYDELEYIIEMIAQIKAQREQAKLEGKKEPEIDLESTLNIFE